MTLFSNLIYKDLIILLIDFLVDRSLRQATSNSFEPLFKLNESLKYEIVELSLVSKYFKNQVSNLLSSKLNYDNFSLLKPFINTSDNKNSLKLIKNPHFIYFGSLKHYNSSKQDRNSIDGNSGSNSGGYSGSNIGSNSGGKSGSNIGSNIGSNNVVINSSEGNSGGSNNSSSNNSDSGIINSSTSNSGSGSNNIYGGNGDINDSSNQINYIDIGIIDFDKKVLKNIDGCMLNIRIDLKEMVDNKIIDHRYNFHQYTYYLKLESVNLLHYSGLNYSIYEMSDKSVFHTLGKFNPRVIQFDPSYESKDIMQVFRNNYSHIFNLESVETIKVSSGSDWVIADHIPSINNSRTKLKYLSIPLSFRDTIVRIMGSTDVPGNNTWDDSMETLADNKTIESFYISDHFTYRHTFAILSFQTATVGLKVMLKGNSTMTSFGMVNTEAFDFEIMQGLLMNRAITDLTIWNQFTNQNHVIESIFRIVLTYNKRVQNLFVYHHSSLNDLFKIINASVAQPIHLNSFFVQLKYNHGLDRVIEFNNKIKSMEPLLEIREINIYNSNNIYFQILNNNIRQFKNK